MPASPGRELAARRSSPVTPEAVADWCARTYPGLRRYAERLPGDLDLDDVLPDVEEALADPELAAVTYVEELAEAPAVE